MPGYRVYYRKDSTFREDKELTKDGVLQSGKLAYIRNAKFANLAAPNFLPDGVHNPLDQIFLAFQGENMPWPIKVAIKKAGVHTSMSIGDVIEEVDTGKMFQCGDPVGWVPVPARKRRK